MAAPRIRVTVGIQSIGDMGLGVARLLIAHGFRVLTNANGRSPATHSRAKAASIELVSSDKEVLIQSDYIFSIVPPRDALETARRFAGAWNESKEEREKLKYKTEKPPLPLYYVDLNAVSPSSADALNTLFQLSAPEVRFVDGGIIGGPPRLRNEEKGDWYKPALVTSGPDSIDDAELGGKQLSDVVNIRHVGPAIGSASGLKMCFASVNKGLTALAVLSYTTAHNLGVLDQLRTHLPEYSPSVGKAIENSLPNMPPKAYRWSGEMQEIADTFHQVSGFGKEMFEGARDIYELIADDTELGKEKTEERVRGKTPEDVALLVAEGLKKKQKTD